MAFMAPGVNTSWELPAALSLPVIYFDDSSILIGSTLYEVIILCLTASLALSFKVLMMVG